MAMRSAAAAAPVVGIVSRATASASRERMAIARADVVLPAQLPRRPAVIDDPPHEPIFSLVSTVAGTGRKGGAHDGSRMSAYLDGPTEVAFDSLSGTAIVTDRSNNCLRRVELSVDGRVTTLAHAHSFLGPRSPILIDDGRAVVVADTGHHRVRMLQLDDAGSVLLDVPIAGTGRPGGTDGPADAASFESPCGLVVAADGSILVADESGHTVRRIAGRRASATGAGGGLYVTTIAGVAGEPGFADGAGATTRLRSPCALALVPDSGGVVLVVDRGNRAIRVLVPPSARGQSGRGSASGVYPASDGAWGVATLIAVSDTPGTSPLIVATGAHNRLLDPVAVAISAAGALLVADAALGVVFALPPAPSTGSTGGSGSTRRGAAIAATEGRLQSFASALSATQASLACDFATRFVGGSLAVAAGMPNAAGNSRRSSTAGGPPSTSVRPDDPAVPAASTGAAPLYADGSALEQARFRRLGGFAPLPLEGGWGGAVLVADTGNRMLRLLVPPHAALAAARSIAGQAQDRAGLRTGDEGTRVSQQQQQQQPDVSSHIETLVPRALLLREPSFVADRAMAVDGEDERPASGWPSIRPLNRRHGLHDGGMGEGDGVYAVDGDDLATTAEALLRAREGSARRSPPADMRAWAREEPRLSIAAALLSGSMRIAPGDDEALPVGSLAAYAVDGCDRDSGAAPRRTAPPPPARFTASLRRASLTGSTALLTPRSNNEGMSLDVSHRPLPSQAPSDVSATTKIRSRLASTSAAAPPLLVASRGVRAASAAIAAATSLTSAPAAPRPETRQRNDSATQSRKPVAAAAATIAVPPPYSNREARRNSEALKHPPAHDLGTARQQRSSEQRGDIEGPQGLPLRPHVQERAAISGADTVSHGEQRPLPHAHGEVAAGSRGGAPTRVATALMTSNPQSLSPQSPVRAVRQRLTLEELAAAGDDDDIAYSTNDKVLYDENDDGEQQAALAEIDEDASAREHQHDARHHLPHANARQGHGGSAINNASAFALDGRYGRRDSAATPVVVDDCVAAATETSAALAASGIYLSPRSVAAPDRRSEMQPAIAIALKTAGDGDRKPRGAGEPVSGNGDVSASPSGRPLNEHSGGSGGKWRRRRQRRSHAAQRAAHESGAGPLFVPDGSRSASLSRDDPKPPLGTSHPAATTATSGIAGSALPPPASPTALRSPFRDRRRAVALSQRMAAEMLDEAAHPKGPASRSPVRDSRSSAAAHTRSNADGEPAQRDGRRQAQANAAQDSVPEGADFDQLPQRERRQSAPSRRGEPSSLQPQHLLFAAPPPHIHNDLSAGGTPAPRHARRRPVANVRDDAAGSEHPAATAASGSLATAAVTLPVPRAADGLPPHRPASVGTGGSSVGAVYQRPPRTTAGTLAPSFLPELLCADRARSTSRHGRGAPLSRASRDALAAEEADPIATRLREMIVGRNHLQGQHPNRPSVLDEQAGEEDVRMLTAHHTQHTAASASRVRAGGRTALRVAPAFVNVDRLLGVAVAAGKTTHDRRVSADGDGAAAVRAAASTSTRVVVRGTSVASARSAAVVEVPAAPTLTELPAHQSTSAAAATVMMAKQISAARLSPVAIVPARTQPTFTGDPGRSVPQVQLQALKPRISVASINALPPSRLTRRPAATTSIAASVTDRRSADAPSRSQANRSASVRPSPPDNDDNALLELLLATDATPDDAAELLRVLQQQGK